MWTENELFGRAGERLPVQIVNKDYKDSPGNDCFLVRNKDRMVTAIIVYHDETNGELDQPALDALEMLANELHIPFVIFCYRDLVFQVRPHNGHAQVLFDDNVIISEQYLASWIAAARGEPLAKIILDSFDGGQTCLEINDSPEINPLKNENQGSHSGGWYRHLKIPRRQSRLNYYKAV